jgi:hypothetical protein
MKKTAQGIMMALLNVDLTTLKSFGLMPAACKWNTDEKEH